MVHDGNLLTRGGIAMSVPWVKTVVCLTVDGGPITQVEKTLIPDIGKCVLSNLRMRGVPADVDCQILWCHFATMEDVLRSMDGVQNLVSDKDPSNLISLAMTTDPTGEQSFTVIPTTFCCKTELDERKAEESILNCSVEDALNHNEDYGEQLEKMLSVRDSYAFFVLASMVRGS
eukprot:TRINITY_DN28737_c0_g1_i1.p1 TRINITY_DN28737_c0_g1~~TRINITY_DN28737_c0_g1_i1.p1  ORF type:complete len:174 (-),score=24.51 TRINITY_DN28737_c0_g1_i1:303-824(-)